MRVELDVFSGRPNPQWELGSTDGRALERLHGSLAPTEVAPSPVPGLGYRGFRYRLGGDDWRAWRGLVSARDRALADPGRSVERLLAATLPPDLADLRPRLDREIGSNP